MYAAALVKSAHTVNASSIYLLRSEHRLDHEQKLTTLLETPRNMMAADRMEEYDDLSDSHHV